MHFWCTFRFSQNLLISRKMEKHLCKFFPISKFTKFTSFGDSGYPTADAKLPINTLRFLCPAQQAQLLQGVFEVRPHEQFARVLELIQPKQMLLFRSGSIENTSPYCSFTLTRAPLCQPPFQTLCCRHCSCNVSNKTVLILQVSPSTDHVVDTTCCQHVFASKILTCLSPDTKLRPLAMLLGCQWCTCGTHSCGIGRPWPEPSPMSTPQRQYYASAWRSPPSSSDSLRAPTTTNIASLQSSWSKYPEMDHKMKRGSCYI